MTDEGSASSLDPSVHRSHIRSLQQTLLCQPVSEHAKAIETLIATYQAMAQQVTLRPHEWQVFLALSLRTKRSSNLSPTDLAEILELYRRSFFSLNHIPLIKQYIGLVLHYFTAVSEIPVSTFASSAAADADEDQDEQMMQESSSDPLHAWTGITGGPLISTSTQLYLGQSLSSLQRHDDGKDVASWQSVCGIDAVRSQIRDAYSRCAYDLVQSHQVWDLYLSFERALLASGKLPLDEQLETVRSVYLARLRVPHKTIDDTFQSFSRFVTENLPPNQYESELSAANKLYSEAKRTFQFREKYEDNLASVISYSSLINSSRSDIMLFSSYWKPYLNWQQGRVQKALRGKDRTAVQMELDLASVLYDRAAQLHGLFPPRSTEEEIWLVDPPTQEWINNMHRAKFELKKEDAEQRQQEEQHRFQERLSIAETIWTDYIATVTMGHKPDASLVLNVCEQSIRCLPTSASLYAKYMRLLTRFRRPKSTLEEVFARIMSSNALSLSGQDLVEVLMGRIDCERDTAAHDLALQTMSATDVDPATDMDKFMEIYGLISYALSQTAELAAAERDASLKLERYAVSWVERAVYSLGGPNSEAGASLNELAASVWQNAVKAQSENPKVYQYAADYWVRRGDFKKARGWYKGGVSKLERTSRSNTAAAGQGTDANASYVQLLDEWVHFEHQFGSMEDIDHAIHKVRSEKEKLWKSWYESYSYTTAASASEPQTVHPSGQELQHETQPGTNNGANPNAETRDADMSIASVDTSVAGNKRKPAQEEEEDSPSASADPSSGAGVSRGHSDPLKRVRARDEKEATRDRENCSVLLSGLPANVTVADIRTFLRGCGRIIEIIGPEVIRDHGQNGDTSDATAVAAALVEFEDRSGAASARTRDLKKLGDQVVSVNIGWKCTLFVTNFPETWEDRDIRQVFGAYGPIFQVRWPSKRFAAKRRFCYVQMTTPEAAQTAMSALNKRRLGDLVPTTTSVSFSEGKNTTEGQEDTRTLTVALSDPGRRKQRTDAHNNDREVFVSGLAKSVTESDLRATFEAIGPVSGVRILRSSVDGSSRGIGFVDFEKTLDANVAINELSNTKIRGKLISVTLAQSPSSKPSVEMDLSSQNDRRIGLEGVPSTAQEALIQQAVEHVLGPATVEQVLWNPTSGSNKCIIEFIDVITAGKATLLDEFKYQNDIPLKVVAINETGDSKPTVTQFVPRSSRGKTRGGGGSSKSSLAFSHPLPPSVHSATTDMEIDEINVPTTTATTTRPNLDQNQFRQLLEQGRKK